MSARPSPPGRQFAVFVAVGVLCAIVDVGLLQLLVVLGVRALPAASVGFLAGLGLNFALHTRVTFRAGWSYTAALRFGAVVLANYLLTLLFVAASVAWWAEPLPGKIVSLPVIALNGFFCSRHWVFR